jgi:hypothetical protein
MINNSSLAKWDRLNCKQLDSQFQNDIKDPGRTYFLSNMSMMNMRIGHRYQISLPNGKLVAGICDKNDHESVILRTLITADIITQNYWSPG